MMASIMKRLILAFVLVTTTVVVALPLNTVLTSDTTHIDLYKVGWTSRDRLEVPANGTLFNPNPSALPIERVCIGSNVPSCACGAEDGTWIAAFNHTNQGCVDISPPLVFDNCFCCVSLDDCALLDQPFIMTRADAGSPFESTLVKVFGGTLSYSLSVENTGYQLSFNQDAVSFDSACILTMTTMSCGFGADDGTWIQLYNETDDGCSVVSPPAALNTIACCHDFSACPALDGPFKLDVRDAAEVSVPATSLALTSNEYGAQTMTVRADGYIFYFDAAHDQISRLCVSQDTTGCVFRATDGTAYAASFLGGNGCTEMDSTKLLYHGFCCDDFSNCPGLNILPSRSPVLDYAPVALQSRNTEGPVVNNILPLMFSGAPDLVGWEYVWTNALGFNVTDRIPWGVGQICMMDNRALCAFVGMDGTITALYGGRDDNCAVVAPPQIIIDGVCCASAQQCNASDHSKLVQLVGDSTMASYMGNVASSTTSIAVFGSTTTLAARAAAAPDVTIQYYGPSGDYGLQWVAGDYTEFTPSVPWGVDQVCIISPQGFCGFWSADKTLGFEVGPVVAGQSGVCYIVGGAYVLAGGICCRYLDGCESAVKALSNRDTATSDDAPPTREITFYGDPKVYVDDDGVTTYLRMVADGHIEKLPAFGQPVVEVCLDGGICQFYLGGELDLGPSILTGNGGCLGFQPNVTLTGVACN